MAVNTKFQKLLEPGYIGSVRTRNRIIKVGAKPGSTSSSDGTVPEAMKDYYEALAHGGAGLVVVEAGLVIYPPPVTPRAMGFRIDDDKFIPSLSELSGAIRKYDCPVFIQMFNMGTMAGRMGPGGPQPVGASSLSQDEMPMPGWNTPRELAVEEIEELVQLFGERAERLQKAGFQGVELNGGCNHLFNSFLSRAWNKRHDAYGIGNLESRAKILIDIIKEIKKRNGREFGIITLINGAEPGLEKGITSEESQGIARILQAAGADAIHVRVEFYKNFRDPGLRESTHFPDAALYPEPPYPLGADIDVSRHGAGGWVPLAAAIKKNVSIPVIAIGRLDPELGEKLLRSNNVDFIGMNRRLMADHDLPNKVAEGRLEDIVPCSGCLICFSANEVGETATCRVNAALGKEKEYEIKPAEKKKRVMVVGGGPAGMETARVAALRGHEVFLYEKESRLGGSMPLAAVVKGFEREDLLCLVNYLSTQMTKLGVNVKTGQEANRSVIEQVKPDVLVLAAGGLHNIPEIHGINNRNVVTSRELHKKVKFYMKLVGPKVLHWLTKFWMPVGQRVIIMGGGIHGCQVAEFLVRRGRKVTILEAGNELGEGLAPKQIRPFLLIWLEEKGTTMLTGVKYEEINDKGLTIIDREGKRQTIEADTVMTALPMLPDNELIKSLEGIVPEIYTAGDCAEPRLIIDAIADGSRVGRAI